jgi:acetolactate synthase regulatory subunit
MARYDDLNTNMIAYAAVLSIVILVIVLQGTQALSYNMMNAADAAKENVKSDKSMETKREQLDSLNGLKRVSVIDEAAPSPKKGEAPAMKKVIQIPIQDAQKLILKELASPAPSAQPST